MRITITQDFDSVEEAQQFFIRVAAAVLPGQVAVPADFANAERSTTEQTTEQPKPARKPRADAGKPRGAYKQRTTTGEPVASEPGHTASDIPVATQPAAPATPTTSSAPQEPKSAADGQHEPPAAAAEESEFPATLDGARAAMAALNATAGKGMDACIGTLKVFGVNRISDLPAEKYAGFIKDVLSQSSPEGLTAGRAKLAEQAEGKK